MLQSIITEIKKLGKSAYLFSVDSASGKVAHINVLQLADSTKNLDAKKWADAVVSVVGGKVRRFFMYDSMKLISLEQAGGKGESMQGVGTAPHKVQEALEVARIAFEQRARA